MKKLFWSIILFAVVLIACGNALQIRAQQIPIAGGYNAASKTSKEVKAAAAFAIKELQKKGGGGGKIKLLSVKQAETQVVAGINYKLCLSVKMNGKTQTIGAIVYKNLQNQRQLSDSTIGSCQK
jgi:hypothetical protein